MEAEIVANMENIIYGPYTGTWFASTSETDIEHIVPRSEAHDSGLCQAHPQTRKSFASDLLNLTLAGPQIKRSQKGARDAAEWLPDLNGCWYADRIIKVRRKYQLTIDQREADSLESVLSNCSSFEMVVVPEPVEATRSPTPHLSDVDALSMWDDNSNEEISCPEARRHGIAPVHRNHPAYQYMDDRDGDGVVCD